ncbi:MAG: hypothetical protein HY887_03640 [Deltaproteobacteria bacterium]|nr:hypothetical protein [Deltaproteobacteria bacterium]
MKLSHGLAAITALMLLSAASIPAEAEMVTIFGPMQVSKTKGGKDEGKEAKFNFTAPVPGSGVLIIKNGGDLGKKDKASSAKVELNDMKIAGSSDFNKKVVELRYDVVLKENNELEVKVKSCEECYIEVTVLGEAAAVTAPPAPPLAPPPPPPPLF